MPSSHPGLTLLARVLLIPYLITLALIVWLPAPEASSVTGVVFEIARLVSDATGVSLEASYAVFEFAANIALFVPFGLLLAASWPQLSPWAIVLLGFATSATIELVQILLPSRYPTVSDVIANTLGAAIGVGLTRAWRSVRDERSA